MENRSLGRGLSALIPDKVEALENDINVRYVSLAEIRENSLQPREKFDDDSLNELMNSIKEKGILQPILVRKKDDGFYEIVAGERRFRAAKKLNFEKVPVIIKSVSDREALVLALIENIQREQLNAIEEAQAFKKLIEDFSFTQDEVAQSVGKERSTVTNTIRLLKLPEQIQGSLRLGQLSVGHARALLSIENTERQQQLFNSVIEKNLSVRELENLIKAQGAQAVKIKKKTKVLEKNVYMTSLQEDLQRCLGTKVRINAKEKRGQIVVEFYSSDDLERIVNIIKK